MISAIVAVDNNWGIGFNGELLEKIPEDMKYFKELTTDHIVVMGRKTWDSLPKKPLKDRLNIILTSKKKQVSDNNISFVSSLDLLKDGLFEADAYGEEIFIIGGGSIYKELLPLCDRVYVTKICKDHENVDTYFPDLDKMPEWEVSTCTELREYDGLYYSFLTYDRIS